MTATPPPTPGTRSNRGDFVDIAGNPVPAPDLRPRCGGKPCQPRTVQAPCPDNRPGCAVYHSRVCPGCPDCRPAPTPSGDDEATTEDSSLVAIQATICLDCGHGHPSSGERGCSVTRADHQRCGCAYYRPQHVADREAAIRAESAAALLEARERLTATESLSRKGHRALAAAEAWNVEAERVLKEERERRKVAEERLREVEGERDRLREALEDISLFAGSNYAAGVEWMRERAWKEIKPAATPSTDEEGR